MDMMLSYETLQYLIPMLSGALIVPVVSWIKKKLPTDLPIQQVFMVSALNFLIVFLMNKYLPLQLTFEQMIGLASLGQVVSQYAHGAKKTTQESEYRKTLGKNEAKG